MKGLLFERKVARIAAATVAGRLAPGRGANVGPIRLADLDPPELPAEGWVRVRPRLAGICGSDLSMIDGNTSRWFEPIVSFPFVPGHEVVGDVVAPEGNGRRVVLVPVLTCATRGIDPPCAMCAADRINLCERVAFGHLEPGLQTGFCESTGGGWSQGLVAHESQLVDVPDDLTDEQAVLVEPAACAVHAARQVSASQVVVVGSGTLGLLTIAALGDREIVATAKYPHQKDLARALGADIVCEPDQLARHVRSLTGTWVVGDRLAGGAPEVVDCVGSPESLAQSLEICAPGGTVHVVGMPGHTAIDLTPLWHREVALRGCYAYTHDDFTTAIELVQRADLGRLVSATYPLDRYSDAIAHAAEAGSRGAVKIAFDLRSRGDR